ncbi:unnamed protein product, partial [marine sediment metagenome]
MGTWDEERRQYYDRGFGFWAEIAGLIFVGVASIVILAAIIMHDGWGALFLLIFWIPVYTQFWSWFGTDYQWPKKSVEQIKREEEEIHQSVKKEIE